MQRLGFTALAYVLVHQTLPGPTVAVQCPSALPTGECEAGANVHLVAFESNMRLSTVYLKASAEANGFTNLAILGTGMSARWGKGMQHKLNSYRRYVVDHVCDCDIVLLVDAGDVLILGSPTEVEQRFRGLEATWNRSLFFATEATCTEWEVPVCSGLDKATLGQGEYRFLNSGLIAGRGEILRRIFREPLNGTIAHDQEWWRVYFLDHVDMIGMDFHTDLFLVAAAVEGVFSGAWMDTLGQEPGSIVHENVDGRHIVANKLTHTRPLILHFPGPGKWQAWLPADRSTTVTERNKGILNNIWHILRGHIESCTLHEVFLKFFPKEADVLKIQQLSEYNLLAFLPRRRPLCVGLDNESPWLAFGMMFTTAGWFAMASILEFCMLSVLVTVYWRSGGSMKKALSVVQVLSAKPLRDMGVNSIKGV